MTWANQMDSIEGISAYHEGIRLRVTNWRYKCPHLVQGSRSADKWNRDAIRARGLRAFRIRRETGETLAEAAHYFAQNLDLVEEFSPKTRIIHLLRDPTEMISSYIAHASPSIYYGKNGIHEAPRERWVKWSDSFPLYHQAQSREERLACHWETCNRAIEATSLPRLLVRTEELSSDRTWGKMLDWLGIDGKVARPDRVYNRARQRYEVSDRARAAVEKFCHWSP